MTTRTHLPGSSFLLHGQTLRRTACGLWLDWEPIIFAEPGALPSCSKCLWKADEARPEVTP